MPTYKPLDTLAIMNPMGVDEAKKYYADPFGYTKEKLSGLFSSSPFVKKPKEEEKQGQLPLGEALRQSYVDNSGSQDQPMNPYVEAFLDAETPEARAERLSRDWMGLAPIGAFMLGGTGGLLEWNSRQPMTQSLLAQKALQYQNIPNFLKDVAPKTFGAQSPYATAANAKAGYDLYNAGDFDAITPGMMEAMQQTDVALNQAAAAQMGIGADAFGVGGGEAYSGSGYNSSGDVPSASDYGFGGF